MINLRPRNVKYPKIHTKYLGKKNKKGITLIFGSFGLKAVENGRIFPEQLETVRKLITSEIKAEGTLYINIFPDQSLTTKAIGSRMGNGKGNVSTWCSYVHAGKIIFEIENISSKLALGILNKIRIYLPIKTKIVFLKKYK